MRKAWSTTDSNSYYGNSQAISAGILNAHTFSFWIFSDSMDVWTGDILPVPLFFFFIKNSLTHLVVYYVLFCNLKSSIVYLIKYYSYSLYFPVLVAIYVVQCTSRCICVLLPITNPHQHLLMQLIFIWCFIMFHDYP